MKIKIDVEKVEESSGDTTNETASSKTFKDLPIKVLGLSEDEEGTIRKPDDGLMDLTVTGDKDQLDDLSEEKITAFIDAENLSEGRILRLNQGQSP